MSTTIICIGLIGMTVSVFAVSIISTSYFNAVGRNPTIAEGSSNILLALAAMVELAILIMAAIVLFLVFKS